MEDYVTDSVFQVVDGDGIFNLSVSRSGVSVIVRFRDRFHEHKCRSVVRETHSALEKSFVRILILTDNFIELAFEFVSLQLKLVQTHAIYIDNVHSVFFPELLLQTKDVIQNIN